MAVSEWVSEWVSQWVSEKHSQWSDSGLIKKDKNLESNVVIVICILFQSVYLFSIFIFLVFGSPFLWWPTFVPVQTGRRHWTGCFGLIWGSIHRNVLQPLTALMLTNAYFWTLRFPGQGIWKRCHWAKKCSDLGAESGRTSITRYICFAN